MTKSRRAMLATVQLRSFLSSCLCKSLKMILYKTLILSVVFYGCTTSSLTPREEHRLRVFENRVLRRIFGSKRGWVARGWERLHNEELYNLYTSLIVGVGK
jgi:hypothetical protein